MQSPRSALLAALYLATHLVLAPGAGLAVVCIGEDGHIALEPSRGGIECIDLELRHGEGREEAGAAAPPCQDTPIFLPTPISRDPQPAASAAPALAAPEAARPPQRPLLAGLPPVSPASAQRAALLRSVVLQN